MVNLVEGVIDRYRQAAGRAYGQTETLRRGDSIAPSAFPDLEIGLEVLLGS